MGRTRERDEDLKNSKVKAKIFTKLLFRHWNAYSEFKRSHLFAVSADANSTALSSQDSKSAQNGLNQARDLTPGDHDVPPFNLGGQDMYAISPDSQELAYTSNIDEVEATSTNNEIFIVPIAAAAVGGMRRIQKDFHQPGQRQHAALFARWEIHRVAIDGAGRL